MTPDQKIHHAEQYLDEVLLLLPEEDDFLLETVLQALTDEKGKILHSCLTEIEQNLRQRHYIRSGHDRTKLHLTLEGQYARRLAMIFKELSEADSGSTTFPPEKV
jgi:hypothetical protein